MGALSLDPPSDFKPFLSDGSDQNGGGLLRASGSGGGLGDGVVLASSGVSSQMLVLSQLSSGRINGGAAGSRWGRGSGKGSMIGRVCSW